MRVRSFLLGGAALAAVAAGSFYYYSQSIDDARANAVRAREAAPHAPQPASTRPASTQPGRPPVPVVVAKARMLDMPVTLPAIGTVEALATVAIKAQIDGQLQQVHFAEGQTVKAGDLLFTIDPRPFAAALRAAEASLARNRAMIEKAKADLRRYHDLSVREFASRARYEEAVANAAALEATIKGDEAQIEMARLRLDYTKIHAPVSGRAGAVLVTAGNLVKANDAALVVVNQTRPIRVAFAVPENRLDEIRSHMATRELEVRLILPEGSAPVAPGKLSFVDNAVDQSTGTIRLKGTFDNDGDRLTPGQFVNLELRLAILPGAVAVPSQAIQIGQRGGVAMRYVYVVKADLSVELRQVEPGVSFGDLTQVRSGVSAGEEVVTVGQLRLRPGAKVRRDADARRMRPRGAK